jgi:hypothetical protein
MLAEQQSAKPIVDAIVQTSLTLFIAARNT